jgi:hypothetical protein
MKDSANITKLILKLREEWLPLFVCVFIVTSFAYGTILAIKSIPDFRTLVHGLVITVMAVLVILFLMLIVVYFRAPVIRLSDDEKKMLIKIRTWDLDLKNKRRARPLLGVTGATGKEVEVLLQKLTK